LKGEVGMSGRGRVPLCLQRTTVSSGTEGNRKKGEDRARPSIEVCCGFSMNQWGPQAQRERVNPALSSRGKNKHQEEGGNSETQDFPTQTLRHPAGDIKASGKLPSLPGGTSEDL